jgi:RHS repeat-associated protein
VDDLDYMHARYYLPLVGRFVSVDPADSGKPAGPQTWNRYAYVVNNPMKYVDPNGEEVWVAVRAATFSSSVGHSFTIINPTNGNRQYFASRQDLRGLQGGLLTLAAARGRVPEDNNPLGDTTRLVKTPNDEIDLNSVFRSEAAFTKIAAPEGMSDEQFELELVRLFDNYQDGALNYNNADFNLSGRNSNAFNSGLLSAAGVTRDVIKGIARGGLVTPGLTNPIPRKYFLKEDDDDRNGNR